MFKSRLGRCLFILLAWAALATPLTLALAHYGEPQARWFWNLFGVHP